MSLSIHHIYSSAEEIGINQEEASKGPADIIVQLSDGYQYIASFVAYEQIGELRELHRHSGDFLYGEYYWCKNLVIVADCRMDAVRRVVEHMLEEGDFRAAFEKME